MSHSSPLYFERSNRFNIENMTLNLVVDSRCGVAVHESCYGMDPEIVGDDNSTESASVTEPWFCEPCIYGEKEPPHCELCPVRYGALKRSGIYL